MKISTLEYENFGKSANWYHHVGKQLGIPWKGIGAHTLKPRTYSSYIYLKVSQVHGKGDILRVFTVAMFVTEKSTNTQAVSIRKCDVAYSCNEILNKSVMNELNPYTMMSKWRKNKLPIKTYGIMLPPSTHRLIYISF